MTTKNIEKVSLRKALVGMNRLNELKGEIHTALTRLLALPLARYADLNADIHDEMVGLAMVRIENGAELDFRAKKSKDGYHVRLELYYVAGPDRTMRSILRGTYISKNSYAEMTVSPEVLGRDEVIDCHQLLELLAAQLIDDGDEQLAKELEIYYGASEM